MSLAEPAPASAPLLGPSDPPAFEIVNPEGAAPILFVCDHAGQAIPRRWGGSAWTRPRSPATSPGTSASPS